MDCTERTIYGVDFSGAKDAGRKIWIAEGESMDAGVFIKDCQPAWKRLDCGKELEGCLEALRGFIAREKAVFSLDFPFGLPQKLTGEVNWENFVRSFNKKYSFPDDFKAVCFQAADFQELKRDTDKEQHAPFSPYNRRIYKQTYFGISRVLNPLVDSGLASVLPMQEPHPDRSWVLEVCPSSTLRNLDIQPSLYKNSGQGRREKRGYILNELEGRGLLRIGKPDLRDAVVSDREGDGLDSIIAAMAAARAVTKQEPFSQENGTYMLEGCIFA